MLSLRLFVITFVSFVVVVYMCSIVHFDFGCFNFCGIPFDQARMTMLLACLSLACRRYVESEIPSMKKLYITRIVIEDAGNYTCSAVIKGNQQRKTVSLRVFR